jgi:hypothetical protein
MFYWFGLKGLAAAISGFYIVSMTIMAITIRRHIPHAGRRGEFADG